MTCPTEIGISDRREAELAKAGFMPLIHKKNSDFAAFIGAQSLQKPQVYDDPDATANAALAARLPYLFATCRFAHYLKCIVRDKVGSFKEREEMQRWLQSWITQYVDGDPAHSSEETKARKPARRGGGRRRGGRGRSRLLQLEVLPAAALPARRAHRVAAPRVEAAVCEGGQDRPVRSAPLAKLGAPGSWPSSRPRSDCSRRCSIGSRTTSPTSARKLATSACCRAQRLRESVRRDLTWLFNTTNLSTVEDLDPNIRRSSARRSTTAYPISRDEPRRASSTAGLSASFVARSGISSRVSSATR